MARSKHPRTSAELLEAVRPARAALTNPRTARPGTRARPATPATAPTSSSAAKPLVLLGIDPGTLNLGYGAIVLRAAGPRLLAAGVLRAEKKHDVPHRLGVLRRELDELLARLKPDIVVVEQAFAARNVQSALRIGEGRGMVLAAAALTGAEIVQYPPAVAKKALVGSGAADKTQIARMVEHILGVDLAQLPLDATDALALALAHVQRRTRLV